MLVDPRAATRTPPSVPSDRRWPGTLGRVNRFDLQRFVDAQDAAGTYDAALAELLAGGKRSHWMWFVFPQVAGLGHSATAQRYAVSGLAEARAHATSRGPRTGCAR